jgi:FKBP-type peptidyl-prolyl cis-trans isomerase
MTPLSSRIHTNRTAIFSGLTGALLALVLSACSKPAPEAAAPAKPEAPAASPAPVAKAAPSGLDSVDQRVSYGVGYNVGAAISKQAELAVDAKALESGIADGLAGAKNRVDENDLRTAFEVVQKRAIAKQLEVAQAFFEKNRARPGVHVTPSGLQYEVLVAGKGTVKPKTTDTVTVHYEGSLLDGTVFDSSIKRGTPAQFPVGGVIHGWTEALQLMSVGDKWKLYIPAALAYGPRANGKIPPNSPLVFEVELLGIK